MSTLSKPQASRNATEARLQPEETVARIEEILQHLDVLPLKTEQHVVRYAYLYSLGLLLLLILLDLANSVLGGTSSMLRVATDLYFPIELSVVLWAFNVWRRHVPHILRDIFEQRRISVSAGDVNTDYLGFLEHYRDALRSPRRYLLIGSLVVVVVVVWELAIVYVPHLLDIIKDIPPHLTLVDTIFSSTYQFFYTLLMLGLLYYCGVQAWTLSLSGWHIRKLSRAFEFQIEPVHPDMCGSLHVLGHFCFGAVSPIAIGFAFSAGFSLAAGAMGFLTPVVVGLAVFQDLLYSLPVAIVAFFLPLWNIHTKMLRERETAEEAYAVHIAALREQIRVLLGNNQLEEAKVVKEKKELMEALYIPYPTWPFNVKAKLFSTVLGAAGSFLLGFLTALPPVILHIIFPKISPI